MKRDWIPNLAGRQKLLLWSAALLALGAGGGAGAVALTRPSIEMAPTVTTAVARLPAVKGIVSVRGHVAEVYGDRFIVQDQTGRALVDAGRGSSLVQRGSPVLVQGRYEDGQIHARYLVDASGTVEEVGPHHPRRGPGAPPPPPPPPPHSGGPGAPPPPGGAAPPATPPGVPPASPPSGASAGGAPVPPPPPAGIQPGTGGPEAGPPRPAATTSRP